MLWLDPAGRFPDPIQMGILGVLLGLAGGVVGAVVIVALFRRTNKEYGWVAWGTGMVVGCGTHLGGGGWRSGLFAAGVTVGALAVAKIISMRFLAEKFLDGIISEALQNQAVSLVAREVMVEEQERGRRLDWAVDTSPSGGTEKRHFPADVWAQAEARYRALPEERRAEMDAVGRGRAEDALSPKMRRIVYSLALISNFNRTDAIFYSISAILAYCFGAGFR